MIKKAVIPAAGLGTRMLPLSKTQPKEMIPIASETLYPIHSRRTSFCWYRTSIDYLGQRKTIIESFR